MPIAFAVLAEGSLILACLTWERGYGHLFLGAAVVLALIAMTTALRDVYRD